MDHKSNSENAVCPACGVPTELHQTCCGWRNARRVVFPGEVFLTVAMTPEEAELRYLISKSPNKDKIVKWITSWGLISIKPDL